ncbi:MAG: uroporphyrinogen decarboxylase family protein [Verrucomicrobiota bacterium]|nr:uroporphyrinogen decarboxylase family protein [Verrucomicrobiota bacterium]
MSSLVFRPDMDEVRHRLTTFWNGGDLGRPAIALCSARKEPWEQIAFMEKPDDWPTWYSTKDMEYRVYQGFTDAARANHHAEAVPNTAPDLAPNCLALFLGCHGVEGDGTVWCEPCMSSPDEAKFEYNADNFYWKFCLALNRRLDLVGKGKFLQAFPDLIEGLDTLAAMRGAQPLLMDMIENPDWVHECLRKITDLYFRYYDVLYEKTKDEVGGSIFWAWAPGRMAKFQCDFSAMISPRMFKEFMLPILNEMCERVSYCMYHWDGPQALPHADHILSIKSLKMVQWTPGEGSVGPTTDKQWWPYYHKIIDAGKRVYIHVMDAKQLAAMKMEFGPKFNSFYLHICEQMPTVEAAEELIKSTQE